MKKAFLLVAYHLSLLTSLLGQNLVPNGDFEQHSACPTNLNQLYKTYFWFNPAIYPPNGGSPDYFNGCDSTNVAGVPSNWLGFQQAHSGNAYGGIACWHFQYLFREYLEVPLTAPLITNECYEFKMYANLKNLCQYTSDDIGVYFSDTIISGINYSTPLPYIPQINNVQGNFFNFNDWTQVSGTYCAHGGEMYLIIGNFYDNLSTTLVQTFIWPATGLVYYYIDDVTLTPLTGVEEQNQNENNAIKIYPNPVKDWLNIEITNSNFQNKKAEIKIVDVLGKEILFQNPKQFENWNLNFRNFKAGIYFIKINDEKNIYRKKFLKE
jgi:hypothetical protein